MENVITTKSRKLEQFFYAHGVTFLSCHKDDEGMTVWTYEDNEENLDPDAGKSQQQVRDEMTGQLNLF